MKPNLVCILQLADISVAFTAKVQPNKFVYDKEFVAMGIIPKLFNPLNLVSAKLETWELSHA
jgi:hypothetical protein